MEVRVLLVVLVLAWMHGCMCVEEAGWPAHPLTRGAVIVTLAGQDYLADYFRWSCTSIEASADRFDMLVFHESNARLLDVKCASNVKYIDLGKDGLSRLFVDAVLGSPTRGAVLSEQRQAILSLVEEVMRSIPRYLVEMKPMAGHMFKDYLGTYSHWSYTDPDILWGSLSDFMDYDSVADFEIITAAKTNDASRLFVRGQFALHRNTEPTNSLWKELDYLTPVSVAERMTACAVTLRKSADKLAGPDGTKRKDYIFGKYFHSAEGWYSRAVFESSSRVRVLILSLGFNDFEKMPVLLLGKRLLRCESPELEYCLEYAKEHKYLVDVSKALESRKTLPDGAANAAKVTPGKVIWHDKACHMQWLPRDTRYCFVKESYDKRASERARKPVVSYRLNPVPEARLTYPEGHSGGGVTWHTVTYTHTEDEMELLGEVAAFFHFRHWDDFLATEGKDTVLPSIDNAPEGEGVADGTAKLPECVFLWLRRDGKLAFQECESAIKHQNGGAE